MTTSHKRTADDAPSQQPKGKSGRFELVNPDPGQRLREQIVKETIEIIQTGDADTDNILLSPKRYYEHQKAAGVTDEEILKALSEEPWKTALRRWME